MTTAPKPFAFVLMPFSKEFDDTYELAIQPACEQAGAYAERVDKQIFTGSILERVFNQISKADLIIADMSERNPNVFYEVGYAHALGKTTILLTNKTDDIPFDLKHYPHIVYENRLADLKRELETRVQWHILNRGKPETRDEPLHVRVNGIDVGDHAKVTVPVSGKSAGLALRVEIHNKIIRSICTAKFQIGLITSVEFKSAIIKNKQGYDRPTEINIDMNSRLYLNTTEFVLRPESWVATTFELLSTKTRPIAPDETHQFSIRIYRDSGVHDYPFTVHTIVEQKNDD